MTYSITIIAIHHCCNLWEIVSSRFDIKKKNRLSLRPHHPSLFVGRIRNFCRWTDGWQLTSYFIKIVVFTKIKRRNKQLLKLIVFFQIVKTPIAIHRWTKTVISNKNMTLYIWTVILKINVRSRGFMQVQGWQSTTSGRTYVPQQRVSESVVVSCSGYDIVQNVGIPQGLVNKVGQ